MTASLPSSIQTSNPVLDDLIEEITAKLHAGQPVDIEEYVRQHPEHADHLRRLLPTLQVLADLSRSAEEPLARDPSGSPLPALPPRVGEGTGGGVLGDFRILREIGRGGMGVVYEAEQMSLGRRVALKVLPFAGALDARQLQRFKNEAQAAAQLHHTNIVPVHYVGSERGVHFYAMQFIEGQTLTSLIKDLRRQRNQENTRAKTQSRKAEKNPLGDFAPLCEPVKVESKPPCESVIDPTGSYRQDADAGAKSTLEARDSANDTPATDARSSILDLRSSTHFRTVAQLGIQAVEALEHAHQTGIIHRDIKPGNLMVEYCSLPTAHCPLRLWITDFGLAHCQNQAGVTMTGDLVGTLRYMSPEQALAKRVPVDHRTDIYSLGATLYELLTLEPAYPGNDRQELLRQIAFEEPRRLRRTNSRIPPELETIVLKAMEKNPADRYSTAQELC